MAMYKKAFTLTELLVVVIVLGVLAAVAAPKFSRVLETRKTAEAEEILSSLRTEQEYRCVQGKAYQTDGAATQTLASAKNSKNYNYTLTGTGAAATSAKGYSIQMPSYKNGQLCCSGTYCSQLNKSYPLCSAANIPDDECAAEDEEPIPPAELTCAENPAQEKCCISSQKWDGTQCVAKGLCEDEDDPEHCCFDLGNAHWDLTTQSCVSGECEHPQDDQPQKNCPSGYTGVLTREWDSFYCRWSDWEGECKAFKGKWTEEAYFADTYASFTYIDPGRYKMYAKYGKSIQSCSFTFRQDNYYSCDVSEQDKVCYVMNTTIGDNSSNNECETNPSACDELEHFFVYRCN